MDRFAHHYIKSLYSVYCRMCSGSVPGRYTAIKLLNDIVCKGGEINGYVKMEEPFLEDNVSDSSKTREQAPGRPVLATPLNPRRRGIIIGASDGLGAALARRLARENYS